MVLGQRPGEELLALQPDQFDIDASVPADSIFEEAMDDFGEFDADEEYDDDMF